MKRREFIALVGGIAATWPLPARAQQPGKLSTIGFLGASTAAASRQATESFLRRLHELGWIEGRTVMIEYRWVEGRSERYAEIAAEFVRLQVNVIVTVGGAVSAVKEATSVIPIVFPAATDPLGSGSVASLARPGGNITGLSSQMADTARKRLELLREVVPDLRRLAIMANGGNPSAVLEMRDVQGAARTLGLEVVTLELLRADEIATVFDALKTRADALYVATEPAVHVSGTHQHLGAKRATTDGLYFPRERRSRGPAVIWSKLAGPVSARRRLCRQDPARSEACRPSG